MNITGKRFSYAQALRSEMEVTCAGPLPPDLPSPPPPDPPAPPPLGPPDSPPPLGWPLPPTRGAGAGATFRASLQSLDFSLSLPSLSAKL